MKDAECSETNEKLNFRFSFFELWLFLYSKYGQFPMNFAPTNFHVVRNQSVNCNYSLNVCLIQQESNPNLI